jgi:hypothetical protein
MIKNIYFEDDDTFEINGLKMLVDKGKFNRVDNIEISDIVYFSLFENDNIKMKKLHYIFNNKYKHIKFIFGSNIEKLPSHFSNTIKNTNKNVYINLLSNWNKELWKRMNYNNVPLITLPSPIDIKKFKENKDIKKNSCFIYIKNRNEEDSKYIIELLIQTKYNVIIIKHEDNITDDRYIEILNSCVFGIWIGDEELQNHRLLQALSCNVPLIVNDIDNKYDNKTSVPYWLDGICGLKYNKKEDFEKTVRNFMTDIMHYEPRQYILDNFTETYIYNNFYEIELNLYE